MTALIASSVILVIILSTDLGTRKVTNMRLLRSIIAVAIVIALFVHTLPLGGNDPWLQLAGIGAGVVFGLIAAVLLPAHRGSDGEIYTKGGITYAIVWTLMSASRVLFAYGSEHWFTEDVIRFSIENKLSGQDVYSNAFVFMALAMVLVRTAVLLGKRRRLRGAQAPIPDEAVNRVA
ncbi:hypothetical protein ABZY31_12650 [Streptomyces sp. NPDC006529]|uniref:hypothetical protein n=1 Tax=Streptomyces sp. NPDC006529 TaxID=3157177 RepID=UPI0033B3ADA7